jgi:hypothetical protein
MLPPFFIDANEKQQAKPWETHGVQLLFQYGGLFSFLRIADDRREGRILLKYTRGKANEQYRHKKERQQPGNGGEQVQDKCRQYRHDDNPSDISCLHRLTRPFSRFRLIISRTPQMSMRLRLTLSRRRYNMSFIQESSA